MAARVWRWSLVFLLSSCWLIVLLSFVVIGHCDCLDFGVHGLQPAVLSASYGHLSLLPKLSVCESFQCVGTDD